MLSLALWTEEHTPGAEALPWLRRRENKNKSEGCGDQFSVSQFYSDSVRQTASAASGDG